jgi:hypothetical protein
VRSIATRRWRRGSKRSRQARPDSAHPSRYQLSWGLSETDRAPPLVDRVLVAHRRVTGEVPALLARALHATPMTKRPRVLHREVGGHGCQVTLIRLRANARPSAYRVFASGDRRLRRGPTLALDRRTRDRSQSRGRQLATGDGRRATGDGRRATLAARVVLSWRGTPLSVAPTRYSTPYISLSPARRDCARRFASAPPVPAERPTPRSATRTPSVARRPRRRRQAAGPARATSARRG